MTAMLDPNTQALIWDAVLGWAKSRNIGVLAVSHDIHLLHRVADRIDGLFDQKAEADAYRPGLRSAA